MIRRCSMLLLVLLALTTLLPTATEAYSHTRMLCLVNRQRQKHGKAPLGPSSPLDRSSLQQSQYQASIRSMTHNDRSGRSLGTRVEQLGYRGWRGVAENIAYGQRDEEDVMQKWMDSPGHRKNILGDYTHLGSAVAYSGSTPYYTQNFASDGKRHSFEVCPGGGSYGGDYGDDDNDDDDSSYGNSDNDDYNDDYKPQSTKKRLFRTVRRVKAAPRKLVKVIKTWVSHGRPAKTVVVRKEQSTSNNGRDTDEDCDDDDDKQSSARY